MIFTKRRVFLINQNETSNWKTLYKSGKNILPLISNRKNNNGLVFKRKNPNYPLIFQVGLRFLLLREEVTRFQTLELRISQYFSRGAARLVIDKYLECRSHQ